MNYLKLNLGAKLKCKINGSIWRVTKLVHSELPVQLRLLRGKNPDKPTAKLESHWWVYADTAMKEEHMKEGSEQTLSLDDFEILED